MSLQVLALLDSYFKEEQKSLKSLEISSGADMRKISFMRKVPLNDLLGQH